MRYEERVTRGGKYAKGCISNKGDVNSNNVRQSIFSRIELGREKWKLLIFIGWAGRDNSALVDKERRVMLGEPILLFAHLVFFINFKIIL